MTFEYILSVLEERKKNDWICEENWDDIIDKTKKLREHYDAEVQSPITYARLLIDVASDLNIPEPKAGE